jgi:hypothetical protein
MEKNLKFKDYADMEQIFNIFVLMSKPDLLTMYLAAKAETGIDPIESFTWRKYRVRKYKKIWLDFIFPAYKYEGHKGTIIFAYLCNGNWKKRLINLTVLEKEFISRLNRLLDDKI